MDLSRIKTQLPKIKGRSPLTNQTLSVLVEEHESETNSLSDIESLTASIENLENKLHSSKDVTLSANSKNVSLSAKS